MEVQDFDINFLFLQIKQTFFPFYFNSCLFIIFTDIFGYIPIYPKTLYHDIFLKIDIFIFDQR